MCFHIVDYYQTWFVLDFTFSVSDGRSRLYSALVTRQVGHMHRSSNKFSALVFNSLASYIVTYPDGQKRGRAFSLYQSNRRNQNNICEQPCVFTNMYFGPPVKVTHKATPI